MEFLYHIKDINHVTIKIITYLVSLSLASLRKSIESEIQAHIAVHEVGHAVLASLTLRKVPSLVVSRTASHDYERPGNQRFFKEDIIITLVGYVAEKMIFGIDHTSGVYADIG